MGIKRVFTPAAAAAERARVCREVQKTGKATTINSFVLKGTTGIF